MKKFLSLFLIYMSLTFPCFAKEMEASDYYNRGLEKSAINQDYTGSIEDFTKAIKLNPNYVEAYKKRASCKSLSNDPIGAIVDFTKIIQLKPNDADAYYDRGFNKLLIKDSTGGMTDLEKAKDLYLNQNNIENYQKVLKLINSIHDSM